MSKLFNNETEENTFYNALANRRIKKTEKEISSFKKEIESAIAKCGEILLSNGARCNFIEGINTLEKAIGEKQKADEELISQIRESNSRYNELSLNTTSFRNGKNSIDNLIAKRDALTTEASDFIKTLPMNIKEDLEFYSNQVLDRKNRKEESLALLGELNEQYPESLKIDFGKVKNTYPFKQISDSISEEEEIVEAKEDAFSYEEFLPTDNSKMGRMVVSIKKAPQKLLNSLKEEENSFEDEEEVEIQSDNTFFGEDDELTQSIIEADTALAPEETEEEDITSIEEVEPDEIDDKKDLEETETKEEVIEEDTTEPVKEEIEEPVVTEEIKPDEIKEEVIESEETLKESDNGDELTYQMDEGDSLISIATILYQDENAWMDLYEANKDAVEQRIAENNLVSHDGIENNDKIFNGINLVIPQTITKTNAKSLAV